MKSVITIPLACLCAWVVAVEAAEPLKDPRLRDENISTTTVTVDVSRNAAGHYVYTYDIDAPISNLGKILTFGVDISCETKPDARGFDASDYPRDPALRAIRNFSQDGKHVPVAVDAPAGQAAIVTIAVHNGVGWAVGVEPGDVSRGLTIISPYPPGPRVYTLIPSIRYKEEQWDYSDVAEDDPEVSWLDDWIVTGITTGPACPGEEYPDDGTEPDARFPGSPFRGQPEQLNELLTYSAPLRDQFHVEAGTRELEMTIHYHETIDPRSFRVTPERNQLRRLFNPRPRTSETVRIPLEPGKNRIELQVQTAFTPPGQGETPPREAHGRGGVAMDRDVFVIRVDGN